MRPGRTARALAALAAAAGLTAGLAAAARPAAADPLDEFGFGSAAAATAGARTATATGPEAAHHNPGGVALGDGPALLVGWGYGAMRLRINGRDARVLDAHGTALGLAVPVALDRDWTLGLGLALYLPDQFLARVQLIPQSEPHFILLDNDPHRAVFEPVAALAYRGRLGLGVGASILADARSNKILFDVGVVGGEKVGQAELDVELPVRLAPLIGVWARPHDRVRAGLTYRGQLSLDLSLDILADVQIAGVVTGDVLVSLRASNYFTPARVGGGLAVEVLPDLTLAADLTWNRWSAYPPAADLAVLIALDIAPPLVSTEVPPAAFTDTVDGKLGVEYRRRGARTDVTVRAGGAWRPSPVPPQIGLTSWADGDRVILTAGAGVTLADWAPVLTRPIDLDLGLQWHQVAHRLTRKHVETHPGQAFSSGGNLLHAGLSATVRF
ncbi:MAG: outer membrane protein transport protein [Kofleriaceae bacterium]|nr:outer membrane protein transport protein [Kofleriaceae bacterium]MCL4227040.1 outer membrane protein transport protein [Myxococcales bacterium]